MSNSQDPGWVNHLLRSASDVDGQRLLGMVTRVDGAQLNVLQRPGQEIDHVYFPDSGWVSMVALLDNGRSAEVGLVGREGMLGLEVALGNPVASFQWLVQGPGTLLRMSVSDFQAFLAASPLFKGALFGFVQHFQDQVAQTAVCNAHHTVEQRLARWILMSRDRSDDDVVPLTHELLSVMLGVRRAGVSIAFQQLRKVGCIDYDPASVTIKDRVRLEEATGGCYQAAGSRMRPSRP